VAWHQTHGRRAETRENVGRDPKMRSRGTTLRLFPR
jgi:hypothetical protein